MRKQSLRPQTGRIRKISLIIGLVVLATLCVWLFLFGSKYSPTFTPPDVDPTAQVGVPTPPETMSYSGIEAQQAFKFYVAGTMFQQQDGSVLVYFTNPEDSGVNLLCEILDKDGTVLYTSGLIESGHYIEKLTPVKKLKNEAIPIDMKVYAYEPETYYSKGVITLGNTLQPW